MATSLPYASGFFPMIDNNAYTNASISICLVAIQPYFKPLNARAQKSFSIHCSHHLGYIPNYIQDPNHVRVFDTTLRDGEQAPGATMTPKQKLHIARQLAKLGVDIIEAGFPASNKADLETTKLIAHEVGNTVVDDGRIPVICGLARCNENDIDKAWEALKYAKFPRVHIFIATSEIHMKYKLKMSKEEVIEKARTTVAYARSLGCKDVQFSPEDAGRSEREFVYEILGEAIEAGATTICIPDTVGANWPREFGQLIADIRANTPNIQNVIISTHCHNDLGLAVANTLEGAYAGARQVEVTINGIGERAGNASLEEVVMTIKCKEEALGGLYTNINTKRIVMASKMVEEYSGMNLQPHKAIVGANAFIHESGIHQDGMLKNKSTYEIMSPKDIGLLRSNEFGLTLGKLSGRCALKAKLFELGYNFEETELNDLFWRFKSIAETKKVEYFYINDIKYLSSVESENYWFCLLYFVYICKNYGRMLICSLMSQVITNDDLLALFLSLPTTFIDPIITNFKKHRFELKASLIMPSSRPIYIPNHIPDPNYIRILDTTLRDGEQSPGASMTPNEKLQIARQLSKLGVDIIEAGFPAASVSDAEAVKLIAQEVGNATTGDGGHVPVICCLARCTKEDIDKAWEAVKYAKFPRILTFLSTSEIHMKYKLNMSKEEVIEKAKSMVAYARSLGCNDIEFGPEDSTRSEREFLYEIVGEVIKAGATTIGIGDTVGYCLPHEFGQLVADIKANTPGIENAIITVHCHNDLGLAVANTLEVGVSAGARQVEVTINGIGERAGNASLEEVVMAIKCKGKLLGGIYTSINTKHILNTSKMVEEYSGMHVQPHKAIVGANAFSHESGIHQDGILKNKNTYEIMSPKDIGLIRSNETGFKLGKLSGRHALKTKLLELGHNVDGKELNDLFWRFKSIAETKKVITDDDLIALVSN
ncbi:hypothetical protein OSB04_013484 [Centaurea solstitialis]|uniref:2-isopropylmalate synthase n=1 Tax=Centaurea solstitialis TaxID=347529 RepID=A0AA38TDC0_9ASTR|nr:hypothetical protein OSB04_013484 [Centaurea solstitialis]